MQTAYKTFRAEVITITPQTARDWLKRNIENRSLSDNLVDQYATALREQRWELNGETVKFRRDGALTDGQHRLHAIVKANIPAACLVVFGLEDTAFKTIDIGKKRTAADMLGLSGVDKSLEISVAATARWILRYHREGEKMRNNAPPKGHHYPADVILGFVVDNPDVIAAVKANNIGAMKGKLDQLASGSVLGFMRYMTQRLDSARSAVFFEKLANGTGFTSVHDPIRALRDKFMFDRAQRLRGGDIVGKIAMAIKAWNAFYTGEEIHVLRFSEVERFPQFVATSDRLQAPATVTAQTKLKLHKKITTNGTTSDAGQPTA